MLIVSTDGSQSIQFSLWRTLGIEIVVFLLSALPLVPGFGEGLRYTSIFYRPELYPILIISSAFLGMIFLALLPLLWRALFGLPAIELFEDSIRIHGATARSISKSKIRRVDGPMFGNLTIKIDGARDATLPLFLYKNSSEEFGRILSALELR